MNLRQKISIVLCAAVITVYAIAGGQPTITNQLVLDGEVVGTWNFFEFDHIDRTITIDTDQQLFDCKEGVIFSDNFEE